MSNSPSLDHLKSQEMKAKPLETMDMRLMSSLNKTTEVENRSLDSELVYKDPVEFIKDHSPLPSVGSNPSVDKSVDLMK